MTSTKFSPPFSEDGSQVQDDTGKWWETDKWHSVPCPVFDRGTTNPNLLPINGLVGVRFQDHWMVRSPLPPPEPLVKPQREVDEEAFQAWFASDVGFATTPASEHEGKFAQGWHAALTWLRGELAKDMPRNCAETGLETVLPPKSTRDSGSIDEEAEFKKSFNLSHYPPSSRVDLWHGWLARAKLSRPDSVSETTRRGGSSSRCG